MAAFSEVPRDVLDGTLVHDPTLVHQNQTIEGIEDFTRRLMDSEQYGGPCVGNLFQHLAELDGTETVKSGRWLVQENHGGLNDELNTDTGSLPFTTRDTLQESSANVCVGAMGQAWRYKKKKGKN